MHQTRRTQVPNSFSTAEQSTNVPLFLSSSQLFSKISSAFAEFPKLFASPTAPFDLSLKNS